MEGTQVTYFFMAITVIASVYAFNNGALLTKWMMTPNLVRTRKEYYRFLTSGLIHGGWMHLIFNMFTFWMFAGKVEYTFNYLYGELAPLYFVLLYVGGVIVSDIPTYYKHRYDEYYNSLGASGGVSAVVFASILLDPLSRICLYGVFCLPGFILGTVYLIYSYVYSKESRDNINHSAHLFGALYGAGFMAVVEPNVLPVFIQKVSTWSIF